MQINQTLSKYQLVPLVFAQDAVAASQTNVQLSAAEDQQLVTGYTMPFAGEIIAISYDLNAAATAGSLTIGPTIAGTEAADPTLTVTTGVTGKDTCNRGKNSFVAGAIIGCEITTSATWDGTTSDLVAVVWVLLAIAGI